MTSLRKPPGFAIRSGGKSDLDRVAGIAPAPGGCTSVEREIYRWPDLAGLIAAPYNPARD